MSTIYRIENKIKTVVVTSKGHTEDIELIDTIRKIIKDPSFEKGFNMYIDFSDSKPGPNENLENINNVAEIMNSAQSQIGKCKWAIFAPKIDAYNFSNLFTRILRNSEIEVKVFQDGHDAKEWLGVQLF